MLRRRGTLRNNMFGNKEIFSLPVFAEIQERTAKAIGDVNRLPEGIVKSPPFAGEVEKIIGKYEIRVPDLCPDQKKGKRRTEQRRDGYGHLHERTFVDVTIPTTGDAAVLR